MTELLSVWSMYWTVADSLLALYVIVCVLFAPIGETVTAVDEAALGVYPAISGEATAGNVPLSGFHELYVVCPVTWSYDALRVNVTVFVFVWAAVWPALPVFNP